jgi:microcystin-dependent protein
MGLTKVSSAMFGFSGMVVDFAGSTAPEGWLECDGSAVSRTTYADLFAAIGVIHGSGDGSTTFNLPDARGIFRRGRQVLTTVSGSGSAASNNATFTAHGFNRTGIKVRLSSGTLSGLSANTDYYAIYIDANTLAFSTSRANALAGTKITISGANSAVIQVVTDPDYASRQAPHTGGSSSGVGSVQEDAMQGHSHRILGTNGAGASGVAFGANNLNPLDAGTDFPLANSNNGSPRTSKETRPPNAYYMVLIKT